MNTSITPNITNLLADSNNELNDVEDADVIINVATDDNSMPSTSSSRQISLKDSETKYNLT